MCDLPVRGEVGEEACGGEANVRARRLERNVLENARLAGFG
jgi:hypothetical protein